MTTASDGAPSIERHLRRLVIAGVSLVLVIACVALDYAVVRWISVEFDRALEAKARALVTLTKQYDDRVELDFADEFMPEFNRAEDPEFFQLWLEDGVVLERSNTLQGAALPRRTDPGLGRAFSDLVLPDRRHGRAVEIVFLAQLEDKEGRAAHKLPPQQQVTLVVARERESLDRTLWRLRLALLLVIALMLGTMAWMVRLAVKRGLRPLHAVQQQLRGLDVNVLNSRLRIDAPPRELQPMIQQFNELLERLEVSFRREQRFAADVAHELRTPVAELRSLAEIATRWPEDQRLSAGFFKDVRDVSLHMQSTIHNLLALARCERGSLDLVYRQLELGELIDAAWLRVQAEASSKQLRFARRGQERFSCYSSPNELELILNNLFSNAVAYGRADSEITASIAVEDGTATLTLSNDTEHLESADLKWMFDRLWRKDPARTGGHHAGLGLSLVSAYAQLLQLGVTVDLDENRRFSLTVSGLRSR